VFRLNGHLLEADACESVGSVIRIDKATLREGRSKQRRKSWAIALERIAQRAIAINYFVNASSLQNPYFAYFVKCFYLNSSLAVGNVP